MRISECWHGKRFPECNLRAKLSGYFSLHRCGRASPASPDDSDGAAFPARACSLTLVSVATARRLPSRRSR